MWPQEGRKAAPPTCGPCGSEPVWLKEHNESVNHHFCSKVPEAMPFMQNEQQMNAHTAALCENVNVVTKKAAVTAEILISKRQVGQTMKVDKPDMGITRTG